MNKLLLTAFMAITLSFANAASATLITQDIFDDNGLIGNVAVDLSTVDSAGTTVSWEEFSFLGFDMLENSGLFTASFNPADLVAGIQSLVFNVLEVGFMPRTFTGDIGTTNTVSIDDMTYGFAINMGQYSNVYFGAATVSGNGTPIVPGNSTSVPEPSTLLIFLTGLVALVSRRKFSK